MHIVLINHYAGTPALGMEYRPYYLAREWVRAGHTVQVLAAGFSHVRARQPALAGRVLDERIDGIDYRWFPVPPYQGNGAGRVWNIARFLQQVWAHTPGLVRERRPDVVIASSTYPLDIWPARRMARAAGAVLVHEVHDLWPLSPIELGGMSPSHPFIRLCQRAEDTACRDADLVVSMLPRVQEHLVQHGMAPQKLHIVPNGITPDEWQGEPAPLAGPAAQAVAEARAAGHLIVGYAGSHGVPNALDVLLAAVQLLQDRTLHFVLVGDGMEKAALAQQVQSLALRNVSLCPPIPKAQVPAFLAAVDIAFIGWRRLSIYRFGIAPNKLMDYMMARRPVLHSVQAGSDPVAQSGCGLTVRPEDPQAIAAGLLDLAALPASERAAMGERGRAFVLAHHTYPVLAQRFLQAITSVRPALQPQPA